MLPDAARSHNAYACARQHVAKTGILSECSGDQSLTGWGTVMRFQAPPSLMVGIKSGPQMPMQRALDHLRRRSTSGLSALVPAPAATSLTPLGLDPANRLVWRAAGRKMKAGSVWRAADRRRRPGSKARGVSAGGDLARKWPESAATPGREQERW